MDVELGFGAPTRRVEDHFALMDRDGYRFEPDRGSAFAIAAFGDEERGASLDRLFTKLWDGSGLCDRFDRAGGRLRVRSGWLARRGRDVGRFASRGSGSTRRS